MTEPCLLIGDIGGTNARFALAHAGVSGFSNEMTLPCSDYDTADDGIADYLDRNDVAAPDVICLAAAGPVLNNCVRFTNNHWIIDGDQLQRIFPSSRIRLMNDFEAIAYSIPLLGEEDIATVGLVKSEIDKSSTFTCGVLGPGTGLGVGGLLGRDNGFYPVFGEGGHAGFAPETRTQYDVLLQLRRRFERVSEERLISGPGIENIYWALQKIHGEKTTRITAAEIFSRVLASEDAIASETVQIFYEGLGQIAGNLALTLGAYDGVYLAGGIVKRYPDLLSNSDFRSGFENKGRHRPLLEKTPTSLILHPQPGLLGASQCARDQYEMTIV